MNKTPDAVLTDEAKNQFTMQLLKAMVKSSDLKGEADGAGAMMYVASIYCLSVIFASSITKVSQYCCTRAKATLISCHTCKNMY